MWNEKKIEKYEDPRIAEGRYTTWQIHGETYGEILAGYSVEETQKPLKFIVEPSKISSIKAQRHIFLGVRCLQIFSHVVYSSGNALQPAVKTLLQCFFSSRRHCGFTTLRTFKSRRHKKVLWCITNAHYL